MIHALHVFTDMRMSDRAKNFLAFLSSYDRKELFVSVILPQESPLKRDVEQTGHPPILLKNIGDTPHSFIGRRALRKEIKRLSPQVIHVYGGWTYDVLRKSGVPLINSPLMPDASCREKDAIRITAPSPWALERHLRRGVPEKNAVLLPPGVIPLESPEDEERDRIRSEFGFEPDDIVVTVFHPFNKNKGYPLLLAAAAQAKKECPNLRFVLVGTGNMKHQYMRKAVSFGLKKSIRFIRPPEDAFALLQATDIGVEISERRPISRTVLEEMSLGKPMIAFAGGGNSFMVENGVTGLLIDPPLSKKISGAILGLVNHPAIALSMGNSGKKRVDRLFSAACYAENVLQLYRDLLGEEHSHEETTVTLKENESL